MWNQVLTVIMQHTKESLRDSNKPEMKIIAELWIVVTMELKPVLDLWFSDTINKFIWTSPKRDDRYNICVVICTVLACISFNLSHIELCSQSIIYKGKIDWFRIFMMSTIIYYITLNHTERTNKLCYLHTEYSIFIFISNLVSNVPISDVVSTLSLHISDVVSTFFIAFWCTGMHHKANICLFLHK